MIKPPENKFTPIVNEPAKKTDFSSKFEPYKICSSRIYGWDIEEYTIRGRKRISYDPRINNAFSNILSIEGPMDVELLFIRVGQVIDKKRGSRINNVINEAFNDLKKKKIIHQNGSTVHNSPIPILAKIRISDEKDRKFIHIPKEEIGSAIIEVLKNNFTSDLDSIKKDVSQGVYNIKKVGSQVDKKILDAIKYLVKNKIIKIDGEKISLIKQPNTQEIVSNDIETVKSGEYKKDSRQANKFKRKLIF